MRHRRPITSVKPGRGPSFMGGVSSLVAAAFGVFWVIVAYSMTRSSPFGGVVSVFPVFGILFTILALVSAVYNFTNATAKERYSMIDITDSETEPDPLNERFGRPKDSHPGEEADGPTSIGVGEVSFCPYCGAKVQGDFQFCPACGRKLPRSGK